MKVLNRTVVHSVFATACFSRTDWVDGRYVHQPASVVHAKTMGTTMTLCGQSSLSWFKFWDIDFVSVRTDKCPSCMVVFDARIDAQGEH